MIKDENRDTDLKRNAPGERGCGVRQPDALYFEHETSDVGVPLEYFVIDPPIDCAKWGVKSFRDYRLFQDEETGIWHLINWVGEGYYPSPHDFLEECRSKGLSRRVKKGFDFSKLTLGKSCIYFAHRKAIDTETKFNNLVSKNSFPPSNVTNEWTEDGGKKFQSGTREVGDHIYEIAKYPVGKKPKVKSGIYFRLPITKITYVLPSDETEIERLKELKIPINVSEY